MEYENYQSLAIEIIILTNSIIRIHKTMPKIIANSPSLPGVTQTPRENPEVSPKNKMAIE